MPIEIHPWRPDTCFCRFVVSVDTDLPSEQITFTLVSVVQIGPEHAGLTGAALLSAVHAENRLKNDTFGEAQAINPLLLTANYVFFFDGSRRLHVSFRLDDNPARKGVVLSIGDKVILQSSVDARFGLGKVVVT